MNEEVSKIQHFLPCGYLKFFAIDGDWERGRKTPVYFTDGEISKAVPVEKLGAEKHTYTKTDPDFEKQFQQMENDYPPLVERILAGERKLPRREYIQLIIKIIDFNLRSVAYENQTDKELKDVYTAISRIFIYEFFKETEGQGTDMQQMADHVEENWRIHIISPHTTEKFITSDNPSTIYFNPKHGRPVMVYLPIHPQFALVAYDRRDLETTSGKVDDDALGVLNGLQIARCVRHAYSDHDIRENAADWEKVQNLANRKKPERFVDGKGWSPDFVPIGSDIFDRFRFIRRKRTNNPAIVDAVKRALIQ